MKKIPLFDNMKMMLEADEMSKTYSTEAKKLRDLGEDVSYLEKAVHCYRKASRRFANAMKWNDIWERETIRDPILISTYEGEVARNRALGMQHYTDAEAYLDGWSNE